MKMLDYLWNKSLFKYYRVQVGNGFRCEGKMIVQGHGNYSIGENVYIVSKKYLNPVGGERTVFQTIDGGTIKIGNNVGISHAILCARDAIIIEDNVLLGGGVKIYDNDFHAIEYQNRIENQDDYIRRAKVIIKEGAFIGAHSIVLKGAVIGRHAVVGAGSVVAKNIPDGEVWAGNPAVFISRIEK